MKKILITGLNSYIGSSFETYLKQWPDKYSVDVIDMKNDSWKSKSFAGYDVVYHVAGIAHSDNGKISADKEKLYKMVNTDLAIEVAEKSKIDNVGQFIFMSSAIVYGNSGPIGKTKIITKETKTNAANCYGDSKIQAENGILPLESEKFKVAILRCPMIYGKGCKGNFSQLEKIAKKFPVFPKVKNERSMLYIGNLVEFVRLIIEDEERGIFWPQNKEFSNTSDIVRTIRQAQGKKTLSLKGLSWILKLLSHFCSLINKAFGNLVYEQSLSEYKNEYRLFSLEESIKIIEETK